MTKKHENRVSCLIVIAIFIGIGAIINLTIYVKNRIYENNNHVTEILEYLEKKYNQEFEILDKVESSDDYYLSLDRVQNILVIYKIRSVKFDMCFESAIIHEQNDNYPFILGPPEFQDKVLRKYWIYYDNYPKNYWNN